MRTIICQYATTHKEQVMATVYAQFQPTGFDAQGLALPDRHDWLVVPVGRNRESGLLDQCNFEKALELLGGESDTVEVHRFGHWACDWYEIILAHPDKMADVEEIENALSEYPVLDDMTYSQACWEAASLTWDSSNLKQRVQYCIDAGVSIFAARREFDMPQGVLDAIIREIG